MSGFLKMFSSSSNNNNNKAVTSTDRDRPPSQPPIVSDTSQPSVDALLHELCTSLPNATELAEQLRVAQRTVDAQAQLIELLLRDRAAASPDGAALQSQWLRHQQRGAVPPVPQPPPPPPQVAVFVAASSEQLAGVMRDVLQAVGTLVLANHGVQLVWRLGEAGDGAALGIALFALKTSRTQPAELADLVQRVRRQVGGGEVLVVTSRTINKSSPPIDQVLIEDYVLQNRHTMPTDSVADASAVLSGLPVVAMHHKFVAGTSEFVSVLDSDLNRQAVEAVAEFVGVRAQQHSGGAAAPPDDPRPVRRIAKHE